MQTLIIYKLGLNHNNHTFTLILLIKIVLFRKCPCTNSINHQCFEMRLGIPRRHFRKIVTKSTESTTYVYDAVFKWGLQHSRRSLTCEAGLCFVQDLGFRVWGTPFVQTRTRVLNRHSGRGLTRERGWPVFCWNAGSTLASGCVRKVCPIPSTLNPKPQTLNPES